MKQDAAKAVRALRHSEKEGSMKAAIQIGLALLLTVACLVAPPAAHSQKSLADGVEDLASKLAKSFGDGTKGRVAIVPLRELAGSENLLGTYIAQTLTNSFFNAGYRDIVERQMLDTAIQELKLKLTGMIDLESAKKIGKFLQADFVVGGTMTDLTGEVVVSCRMFKVETGQVVAVAESRLVKDDNVKTMWEKKTSTTNGGPPPPTDEKYTQEAAGISFQLRGCDRSGDVVTCKLAISALTKDMTLNLRGSDSRLMSKGTEAPFPMFSYGGRSSRRFLSLDLARGIESVMELRFGGVDTSARMADLIEIGFSATDIRSRTVQFRDVVLGEGGM